MSLRLFCILVYIFVAIELLAFFINTKFRFYCSRELSVFGIENKTIRKQDWFFAFCVYKNVLQKNCFLYIKENYNDYHWRKTTSTFHIYKWQKKVHNNFTYKNIDTLQKARQFASRFIFKKPDNLQYEIFHEIFRS